VAAKHKAENRARRGSIPGSIPWPEPRPLPWPGGGGQGAPWSADWWRAQFSSPARLREWIAEELTTGRLLPWFAVAYGAGVIFYFTAEREPALWAAIALTGIAALGAMLLHLQIVPQKIALNVIALGLFGIALGFAVATLKTALIGHPVLRFPASGVTVTGFVELREESQHTDRFVLRVDRIDGGRIEEPPRRVRLSVKRGMAPAAGSFVEVKASLEPPLQPLEPTSIPPEQPDQLALNAHAVGRKDANLVGRIGRLERDRGAAAAEALEGGLFIVDQRDDNIAGIGGFGAFDQGNVAVEDAGLDHRIAAHLERKMLPGGKKVGRHIDSVAAGLDRLDRRAGGDAAHHRHCHGAVAILFGSRADAAEIALDHAWREPAGARRAGSHAMSDRLRKLDHFDGTGPIGQAANEATLFERGNEAVDARLGPQVQRILHFVE
jgi:hypothetical protein